MVENNNYSKIPIIILSGKRYINKEKHVRWANYVKTSIKSGKVKEEELEKTVFIMGILNDGEYSPEEIVGALKDADFSVEELYHIIKNLLLFYKDGPEIFREFFGKYMNPQLEEIIRKVEAENREINQNSKARQYKC